VAAGGCWPQERENPDEIALDVPAHLRRQPVQRLIGVNAALRGFERRGWIQVRNQVVTVKQAAALGRFAGD